MSHHYYKLVFFYLILCVTIILRIHVEHTRYISPDSWFYLSAAENLSQNKGLLVPVHYIPDRPIPDSCLVPLTLWPAGYPMAICLVHHFSSMPVLESSKLTNLLFLGGLLFLIFLNFGKNFWMYSLVFCTYGMLEIYSYTWSESGFLFFWCGFCLHLAKLNLDRVTVKSAIQLTFWAVGCFFFRYIGILTGFLILFFAGFGVRTTQPKTSHIRLFGAVFCIFIVASLYFIYNYGVSGYFTGGNRIQPLQESFPTWGILCLKGTLNEFFLFQKYWFTGVENEWPFFIAFAIQGLIIAILLLQIKNFGGNTCNLFEQRLLWIAGLYWITICLLRKISPFDPINYRLLAPSSFIVLLASLSYAIRNSKNLITLQSGLMVLSVFGIIWNLPKKWVADRIFTFIF